MFKNTKFKKAFTLVEMLIVVIIIGILMGALLPKLKWAQERARDTARKANLTTISTALEMYFNDNGSYPTWQCVSDLWPKLVPTYVSDLPSDPQKWRIAFWTKDGWCSGWVYSYSPLYRKWSKNGWSVLVANIEAQGSVWNFILPQDENTNDIVAVFSGSNSTTKIADQEITSDDTIKNLDENKMKDGAKSSETIIWDASYGEKFTCSKTKLVPSTVMMCNRVKWWLDEWKALVNNAMVYVIFN